MRPLVRSVFVAVAFSLAACGIIPLRSLSALSRIDAQTKDLSVVPVALRLPASVRLLPHGVSLETVVKIGGEPDGKAAYRLGQIDDLSEMAGLPASAGGTHFYLFHFVPEDAARFEALPTSVLTQKQGGKSASIGIGVATKELCRVGDLPLGPMLATTFLRTSETRTFVEASRDLDLRADPNLPVEIGKLALCPALQ